jgi:hypothetical protein
MSLNIGFFDDAKIGLHAKRLADCFNISARMGLREGNPLAHAEDLFTASTGLAAIPVFNDDEEKYLKWKLVETAAALNGPNIRNLSELEEAADVLHRTAKRMKLIR